MASIGQVSIGAAITLSISGHRSILVEAITPNQGNEIETRLPADEGLVGSAEFANEHAAQRLVLRGIRLGGRLLGPTG